MLAMKTSLGLPTLRLRTATLYMKPMRSLRTNVGGGDHSHCGNQNEDLSAPICTVTKLFARQLTHENQATFARIPAAHKVRETHGVPDGGKLFVRHGFNENH